MSTTSLPKILNAGQDTYSKVSAQRAFIIGTDSAAVSLAQDLINYPEAGILPVGFIREPIPSLEEAKGKDGLPSVLGTLQELPDLMRRENVSVLFLAGEDETTEGFVHRAVAQEGISTPQIYRTRSFYETVLHKIPSFCISDTWFRQENGFRLLTSRPNVVAKRAFDMAFGSVLAVGALPVMLAAALAVKMDSTGPILYSQMRTGEGGKPFRVFKFRSMYQNAEQFGAKWACEQDPRITRVGRFLRATRIDELPQLWNVLKGEMSLIGPRPERPEFDTTLAEQIPHYQTRYRIKPGLSGWAQVMYPYGASVEDARQKLAYDLYYIKHCSILLDMQITLKTIQVVLFRKGR